MKSKLMISIKLKLFKLMAKKKLADRIKLNQVTIAIE